MSVLDLQTGQRTDENAEKLLVNDFVIVAATVNGSGSATANNTLVRALFKMGIPVNSKNLFPSNIYGLPTWYTIRLNKDGYTARREDYHVLVAFNPKTQVDDIQKLQPGGICVYPLEWKLKPERDDIAYIGLPVRDMVKESGAPSALREYVGNMVYVGALVELLGIEVEEVRGALSHFLKGKEKAIALNFGLVEKAIHYIRENYPTVPRRYAAQRMDGTKGKIMIDGNSAAALGSIWGGVTVAAWYPITPSTSLIDSLSDFGKELRTNKETGETTLAVVQAEDELAAIGMVIGAGWMGARAMTATSGPGISLMQEFAGLGFFAEVPAVIWDIQRVGPSTGLPTRTSQGDVLKAYFASHGDTRHVVLLPADMKECFEFGWRAFDLADRLQTPVFVLSDLDLGMNMWMSEPFDYPDKPFDRGKTFAYEDLEQAGGRFSRYKDVDGDGIGYRSMPTQGPPWFARGTGHNEHAVYSERPDDWFGNMERLGRKFDTARTLVPAPVTDQAAHAPVGILSYGSNDSAIVEGRDLLTAAGLATDYQRVRALPLRDETRAFLEQHERVYVIENNYLGQMAYLLRIDYPEFATKIISLPHQDGLPLTASWVRDSVLSVEKER